MDQAAIAYSPARSQLRSSRPAKRQTSLIEAQPLFEAVFESPVSVFEVLLPLVSKGPVEVEIPECLVQPHGKFFPVLLFSQDRIVRKVTGSHTFNKFFELVDLRLTSKAQVEKDALIHAPKYCLRGYNTEWIYCMGREECTNRWNALGQDQYLLCRYMRAISLEPRLYRVVYKEGSLRGFKIANRERSGRSVERKSTKRVVSRVSIYQHSPADFHYAGKLLRESFSPYLPYPSRLASRQPVSLTSSPSHSRQPREVQDPPHDFMVNTSNPANCTVTFSDQVKPELAALVRGFVTSVERLPRQGKIEELVLDCVKVTRGEFVVVGCMQFKCNARSPHERDTQSLRHRFQLLKSAEPLTKTAFPPIPGTAPQTQATFIRRKLSDTPDRESPSPAQTTLPHSHSVTVISRAASHLSTVEEQYDSMLNRVRNSLQHSRNLQQVLDSHRKDLCEDLVEHLIRRIQEDATVRTWFERLSREPDAVKHGLLAVFRGEANSTKSSGLKGKRKVVAVTETMRSTLESMVTQTAQILGVLSDHLELILTRLGAFLTVLTS